MKFEGNGKDEGGEFRIVPENPTTLRNNLAYVRGIKVNSQSSVDDGKKLLWISSIWLTFCLSIFLFIYFASGYR